MGVYRTRLPVPRRRPGLRFVPSRTWLASRLVDTFDDNTIGSEWTAEIVSGSPTISETAQLAQITLDTGAASQGQYASRAKYDLRGSEIRVEIADHGGLSATKQTYLRAEIDANNQVYLRQLNTEVHAMQEVGGTTTQLASATATATHFRIREVSGTTYWEFSTDGGQNFTTLHSAANPISLAAVELNFGTFSSAAGGGTVKFDNFNTGSNVTVVAPAAALTLGAAAPVVEARVIAPAGNLTLGAAAPVLEQRIVAPAGDMVLGATPPTLIVPIVISPPAANLTLGAKAPVLEQRLAAPPANLTLGATAPTLGVTVPPPAANLTLGATPPIIRAPIVISPPAANLTLGATPPAISTGFSICLTISHALTGTVDLTITEPMTVEPGIETPATVAADAVLCP